MKPLSGRVAVVTGATRGLGASTAIALAAEGAHIIAIGRKTKPLEEVDDLITGAGGSATLVPLNLTDGAAIDRLGASIHERWGKLDILVGNAGQLGVISPLPHIKAKVWDETMAVNVTANWRLIRSLDPLLRQSDAGRCVFLTSLAARMNRANWGVYGVSKAALEALVFTYANEMKNTRVRVNLFSPGPVRTGMRAQAIPGEDPSTLPHPDDIAPQIVPLCRPDFTQHGALIECDRDALTKA